MLGNNLKQWEKTTKSSGTKKMIQSSELAVTRVPASHGGKIRNSQDTG